MSRGWSQEDELPHVPGEAECREMMYTGSGALPWRALGWAGGGDYSRAGAALQGEGLLLNGETFKGRRLLLKWTSEPSESTHSSYAGPRARQHLLILQWYSDLTP